MGRAPCCDKANVKRGPWSPEEDQKLKSYIENHGTGGNWIALPQKIGLKRCGKSCRLRWLNYLRPNIRHGGFTEDEDNLICNLYISIGSRWSIIAAQLPGRTDNDIKNYWNTRLKKKLLGTRQRRENKIRGAHYQTQNYDTIINEYCSDFGRYPPPPHLVVAAGEQTNSLADISFTTPTGPGFLQHDQNLGNICYGGASYDVTCAQFNDQKLSAIPTAGSHQRLCGSNFQGFIGAPPPADHYVPAFDETTTTDGMIHGLPEQLDGHDLLSAVEMINNSWGDHAAEVICPRKMVMSQDQWSFFDEQRLLGYSE